MCSNYDISIASLNVRGINHNIKREAIFHWARKQKFDILFLQETYSDKNTEQTWKNEWNGDIIFAHGSKHSRGTMILFKPGLNFKLLNSKVDSNGRYIIAEIDMESKILVLVNIYAPNKEQEKKIFFKNVTPEIKSMDLSDKKIICGGDMNSTFSDLDKSGGKQTGGNIVQEMNVMIEELDFVDIWRVKNPDLRRYTYRQKNLLFRVD